MASFSHRLAWPIRQNELSLRRAERLAAGLPLLDFSQSNPTSVGLARDAGLLLPALADPRNLHYEPDPRGGMPARETLAARYLASGRRVEADELFLSSSTSEAYGWLFKLLCDPGDTVLVPRPGYPLFDYLAALEAVELRPYRLEYRHPRGWSIDLESVATALSAGGVKALILINPNNPTGSYISRRERDELCSLCRRHGAALLVDEVFFEYPVEGGDRVSFAGEDAALCFVLDGLSKLAGLPQLKLGWIAVSGPAGEKREACGRLEILADAYLSASAPVMNALPVLLTEAEVFRRGLSLRCEENLRLLRGELEQGDSPHRVLRCAGGWTALIESPRLASEEDLALGLLREEGLWSQPGYFFDMEREAFFSASLILPPETLRQAAAAYRRYFDNLMERDRPPA